MGMKGWLVFLGAISAFLNMVILVFEFDNLLLTIAVSIADLLIILLLANFISSRIKNKRSIQRDRLPDKP